MAECIAQLGLDFHEELAVVVGFDAPDISSDGGAVLLRQVDDRLGLSAWISRLLPDGRNALQVAHDRLEQVRQRLYQIALGYEDCNDAQSRGVVRLMAFGATKATTSRTIPLPTGCQEGYQLAARGKRRPHLGNVG